MGLIQRFSLMFLANGMALYLTNLYFETVLVPTTLELFALATAVLALINMFIKPLIRLALGPILILTLGLGSILVNALTLFLLDFLMTTVTIGGLSELLVTAIVVSVLNIVISFSARFI